MLRKGSGFDLCDLTLSVGFLREEFVRFYSSEIICGLEYLHAMNIVHLDVKPTNILLDDWGHVFITDFDRAYDMTREAEPPKETDFAGTPFFRAPEVRDKIAITTKADVWSLGILVAAMIYTRSAINRWIRIGPVRKDDLPNASVPLQQFLRACLSRNHVKRVAISDVKRLQFFEDVNWEQVVACKIQPPYHPSQLKVSVTKDVYKIDPYDHLLLAAAYRKCKPLIDKRLHDYRDRHGVRRLMELPTSRKRMLAAGLTVKKMDELFADFEFTNPHFLQSSRGVDGDQAVSGHRHGSSDCKEDKLKNFS